MRADTGSIGSKVSRGLGWSTGGNLTLRIGNVLVSIMMARLIAPAEFGVFAVALTVWAILGTLAELGLGSDLVRAEDPETRIPTVATLGILTSVGIGVLMATTAGPVAELFRTAEAADVIRVMSISLLVFGLTIVPAAMLQREFRQGTLFAVNAAGLAGSAITIYVLATHGFGAMSLAWAQVVNQSVVAILLYVVTRRPLRLGFDVTIARDSAAFCLPLAAANLLSWVLLSADRVVIAQVAVPAVLGLYVMAFNVSMWPMSALGVSLRVVALPAFSRSGADRRARALVHAAAMAWSLALLLGVGLSTLAWPTIRLLYGERWQDAAIALTGLAVFGSLRVLFDLLVTYLIAIGRSRQVLAVQIWWLCLMVPAMWLGVSSFGLAGAAWTHVAVAVIGVLPAYLWFLQQAGVNCRALLSALVLPTVAVLPTAAACWWLARAVDSPLLALAAGALAGLILFVAPMTPWWRRHIRELRQSPTPLDDPTFTEQVS